MSGGDACAPKSRRFTGSGELSSVSSLGPFAARGGGGLCSSGLDAPPPSLLAAGPRRYRGLGISLGNSGAWNPQKVGGCGWTYDIWNSDLSPLAQDTAHSWFRGSTQSGPFLAIFGAVSTTSNGVRGQERALCHKAHVKGSRLGPKKSVLGAQNTQFWEGTSQLGATTPGQ